MAGRVFDFQIEGMSEPVKLASMPWKLAKAFVQEGKELLERSDLPDTVWTDRRDQLVKDSIARAGGYCDDVSDLYDGEQLNEMQLAIMKWSGLRTTGEAKATSISAGSKAA